MAITLKLKRSLGSHEEQWLAKNIGPRMHYMHNSIGGQGWIAKLQYQTIFCRTEKIAQSSRTNAIG
jgi:hypothetical protein